MLIPKERRKFPRLVLPCLTKVRKGGFAQEEILSHADNISRDGICIIMPKILPRGCPVTVKLDLMDGDDLLVCHGKVVWNQELVKEGFLKLHRFHTGITLEALTDQDNVRIDAAVERYALKAKNKGSQ